MKEYMAYLSFIHIQHSGLHLDYKIVCFGIKEGNLKIYFDDYA